MRFFICSFLFPRVSSFRCFSFHLVYYVRSCLFLFSFSSIHLKLHYLSTLFSVQSVHTHTHTKRQHTTAILTRWFFVLSSFLPLSSNIVFIFVFIWPFLYLLYAGWVPIFVTLSQLPTPVIIKLMAIIFWLAECSQWLSGEKVSFSFGILSFLFGSPLSSDGRNGQRSPLLLSLRFALKLPTRKNRLPSRSWLYFSTTNRTFFFTLQGNQITATPISYISVIISCVYWNKT